MAMKIIYMGTPEFSVPPLEKLIKEAHNVVLVISQPDRAKDRGKKMQFTPVKQSALDFGIPVMQPEKIRDNPELISIIRELAPDCIIVCAYGRILPKELLEIPRYGCINIHASLLPKYRGAAPIQWSIINGDPYTGVSIMAMSTGLDTGDVLETAKTTTEGKTSADLHRELSILGAEMLASTLRNLPDGKVSRTRQNDSEATYAPMIEKKDGLVDFSKSPIEIERLIRGLYPWPSAYTSYHGETIKLLEAEDLNQSNAENSGTVTRVTANGIEVSAGGGTLLIKKIQLPGKNPVAVKDYLLGHGMTAGAVFGEGKEV